MENLKSRELLEKFIKDNFDVDKFQVEWHNSFFVTLSDYHGDKLELITINPYVINSAINGQYYLSYRLDKHFKTGQENWVIVNDDNYLL